MQGISVFVCLSFDYLNNSTSHLAGVLLRNQGSAASSVKFGFGVLEKASCKAREPSAVPDLSF